MGYWSKHPMGGDTPMDAQGHMDWILFPEDEYGEEELDFDEDLYKKVLIEKIEDLLQAVEDEEDDEHYLLHIAPFVIPFTIHEQEIQIKDEIISKKIKALIQDGGASERGYDIPSPTEENYPTIHNNWNALQTPFDYARKLHDLWDGLMDGSIPFKELEQDIGLFATIEKRMSETDGKPGIINTN